MCVAAIDNQLLGGGGDGGAGGIHQNSTNLPTPTFKITRQRREEKNTVSECVILKARNFQIIRKFELGKNRALLRNGFRTFLCFFSG